jgi:SAM-dependent methyltransferase
LSEPRAVEVAEWRASAGHFLLALARHVPLNHAVWRASEAAVLAGVPMKRPILDIGCGDGLFARLLFKQRVDVGVDLSISQLIKARESGAYERVETADATNLPFPDASFETVFSNCVLEHIPEVDLVCREAARVLRPGGTFVFTVPTDRFADFLFYPALLRSLRAPWLGRLYVRALNRVFRHYHTDSPERWKRRLAQVGLTMEADWQVMPLALAALWDLLMPFAFVQIAAKRIAPRWPYPVQRMMLSTVTGPLADMMRPRRRDGANMVIVARKPA